MLCDLLVMEEVMTHQTTLDFDGPHYEPEIDRERLTAQMQDILKVITDKKWHTVDEIHEATGHPHASISAQLRNMRKEQFGGLEVLGRYRAGTRIFEYRFMGG